MSENRNKLARFWQELKRRRVIHVMVVYATAAFAILEAADIIFPRLGFHDQSVTYVLILLGIGFPIALIFSWLYDLTSEGIKKTKPLSDIQEEEKTVIPIAWKIATYVSVIVIIGLRVISKDSSAVYQGDDMSTSEIALELNVDAVVETSIMCLGDSICLQVRVISAFPEEKTLWIADYREEKSQIFNLNDQITKQIANELRIRLTADEDIEQ